mmetsp:Transcript_29686/g.61647  ORF Transcript_29686/g.61647 Transcript_29686/m.61647 type:complete len:85 (-) Transcript_29686:188-442(-)
MILTKQSKTIVVRCCFLSPESGSFPKMRLLPPTQWIDCQWNLSISKYYVRKLVRSLKSISKHERRTQKVLSHLSRQYNPGVYDS